MSEHQSMLVPSWFSQALGNCITLSLTLVSISSTGEKLALAFERAPTAQGASLPRQMHPQKLEKHVFQHKAQHLLAGSCAPLPSDEAASSANLVAASKHAVSPMSLSLRAKRTARWALPSSRHSTAIAVPTDALPLHHCVLTAT